MAQVLLYGLEIVPGPEGSDGEAVAQVMQAGLREADRGHKALVVVIDRVGRQALPDLVAEHEPGILPQRPGLQLRLRLLGLVPLQELDHEGRGSNGPALAVLGGDQVELPRPAGDLLELFVDGDGPALQVDAVPGEAAGFPTAQACKEHGQIDGLETVALDGLEKGGGGGFVQRLDLLLLDQWQFAGVGGVEPDIAHLHRLLEGLVENAVEVLDCLWGVVNAQTVVELLNGRGVQGLQPDRAHSGLEVVPDVLGVVEHRQRFHTAQVVPRPDVQPLPDSHFAGGGIGALGDLHGGGLHLLPDLLLGLAGEGALKLFAGAGVPAGGDPGLPVGVGFAVAGDGLLADGARALRCFLCHCFFLPFLIE